MKLIITSQQKSIKKKLCSYPYEFENLKYFLFFFLFSKHLKIRVTREIATFLSGWMAVCLSAYLAGWLSGCLADLVTTFFQRSSASTGSAKILIYLATPKRILIIKKSMIPYHVRINLTISCRLPSVMPKGHL